MLTVFTETSPVRTSEPLRKHMWETMDQGYVLLSFQFQFAFKLSIHPDLSTKYWLLPPNNCCVDVHDIKKHLWVELLELQRTYGYFTPSCIHFTGRKNC